MPITDVLYTALATIAVIVVLHICTFLVTRMIHPPEPKIIYREVPVPSNPPPMQHLPPPPPPQQNGPAFTQKQEEIQLPEYEPRKPASTSLRLDTEFPAGLQETRPTGT